MRARVTEIVQGGSGLARFEDGSVELVPFTARGDLLEWIRPGTPQLIQQSEERVAPLCPYFGTCGGCQFQHLGAASEQLAKERLLIDALTRMGGLTDLPSVIYHPSASLYHYRARIRVRLDEQGRPGYYAANSRTFVPVSECAIACKELSAVLQSADFYALQFRGEVELTFLEGWSEILAVDAGGKTQWISLDGKSVRPFEGPISNHAGLYVSPDGFVQPNQGLNRKMVDTVIELVRGVQGPILELYAGNGNFSLPLARAGHPVIGCESNGQAVQNLNRGAREQSLSVSIAHATAARFVLSQEASHFVGAVLLDPPREGAGAFVLARLKEVAPRKILYLSCNPKRLAGELRILLKHKKYRLAELHLFDQFPRTIHMEVLALLTREVPRAKT